MAIPVDDAKIDDVDLDDPALAPVTPTESARELRDWLLAHPRARAAYESLRAEIAERVAARRAARGGGDAG